MQIGKIGIVLAVFGSILAALLSGINILTKDVISDNKEITAQEMLANTIAGADSFCTINLDEDCGELELKEGIKSMYYGLDENKEKLGIIYLTETSNSFGTFTMMTGISMLEDSFSEIIGFVAVEANQTPGYGKDLLESGMFRKAIIDENETSADEISAGASVTGNSVRTTINSISQHFNIHLGDGTEADIDAGGTKTSFKKDGDE